MANQEHLDILRQEASVWNDWRLSNSKITPDLREANLRGADLYGADLREADLREADLREADLRGADLRRADLYGADLREADLRGANLQEANLFRADLHGADLHGADLYGANLRDADLRGADLGGADIDFASWPLWCGSKDVKIDERIARQLLAHAFQVAGQFCPPTPEQVDFCNGFHRIQSGDFPKIELPK